MNPTVELRILITQAELLALTEIANEEVRTPEQQAHFFVRKALLDSGIFKITDLKKAVEMTQKKPRSVPEIFEAEAERINDLLAHINSTGGDQAGEDLDSEPDEPQAEPTPGDLLDDAETRVAKLKTLFGRLTDVKPAGNGGVRKSRKGEERERRKKLRAEKKSALIPEQYRRGKETIPWRIFVLLSRSPDEQFTYSRIVEELGLTNKQISLTIYRMVRSKTLEIADKQGRVVSVKLTEPARQLIVERRTLLATIKGTDTE